MMLSSEAFGNMARQILAVADRYCHGRCLFAHEGGYSKDYVPFCGLAVLEALTGQKNVAVDPSLHEVHGWGYQDLQVHQAAVVDGIASRLGLTETEELNSAESEILDRLTTLLKDIPEVRRSRLLSLAAARLR